jgi:hypothetical protein
MGVLRKALWVSTGGASGLVFKANSKKARTAKALEYGVRLQKQQIRQERRATLMEAKRERAARSAPIVAPPKALAPPLPAVSAAPTRTPLDDLWVR